MDSLSLRTLAILMCLSGTVAGQSLQYGGIQEVGSLKRGKQYSIRWHGGTPEQKINIVLKNRTGVRVQSWTDLVNDGEQTIKLKSNLKPRRGYVLDITIDGIDPGVISSSDIRIRRRIPLAVTISTIVIVPTLWYLMSPVANASELPEVPPPVPQ